MVCTLSNVNQPSVIQLAQGLPTDTIMRLHVVLSSSNSDDKKKHPPQPITPPLALLFSLLTGGGDVRTLMHQEGTGIVCILDCVCVCVKEKRGTLFTLLLNVGRGMTSLEEMDQGFISPTFTLNPPVTFTFTNIFYPLRQFDPSN